MKQRIILGVAGLAAIASTANAAPAVSHTGVFRTTGYFVGLTQGTTTNGNPVVVNSSLSSPNLVNLAMGRSETDTNYPNQVLAIQFAPNLGWVSVVVYDQSGSNIVATVAQSTTIDVVEQQNKKQAYPNSAHFVATLLINPTGNSDNALQGGYFTLSGRVDLDPSSGVPTAINGDSDPLDPFVGNVDVPSSLDYISPRITARAGLAHTIGDLDILINGTTETLLVPQGAISIHQELPLAPIYTGAS